ncbi:MAG TPA: adenylyltransferase/cytidyltransferase family protein [Candidatus Paceibacterota bacterium]|nr:adenylyltransferase/cytidyltransferase family protein [Candidatus Paceibacterota bacterium]
MKNKKDISRRPAKKIVVAVSGGFDPIHIGHVRMFERSRALGDELVVILNNDHWLNKKKGFAFMPEKERKEVIEALRSVDRVVITKHKPNDKDMSVSRELRAIRPDIFANGGDRKLDNVPEVAVCDEIGCTMVFNVGKGGKIQSSSWLLKKHAERQADSLKRAADGLVL